jgi:hypothetical protein
MFTQMLIPIVAVVTMLANTFGFSIPAQPLESYLPPEEAGFQRGFGEVISIGTGQFTIQNRFGEHTILVDDQTNFKTSDGSPASFSDLQIGDYVLGRAIKDEQGQLIARLVFILPDGFDPSQVTVRASGIITRVDPISGSFAIKARLGDALSFRVDGSTVFVGEADSLTDLTEGMQAGVGARRLDDGTLLAVIVGARYPRLRFAGDITGVDLDADTFSMRTRRGEGISFRVDGNTLYRGEVDSLNDLQEGMGAIVTARKLESGLLAVSVVARQKLDKYVGNVRSINEAAHTFTITSRQGDEVTFVVTDDTRFRSRNGSVQSLADLKPGMIVRVSARNASHEAVLVVVLKPPR